MIFFIAYNRTILELKQVIIVYATRRTIAYNRTILELKLSIR